MDLVLFDEAGQGDHFDSRPAFFDRGGSGYSVHLRHEEIHQDHIGPSIVRLQAIDGFKGLSAVGSLIQHLDVVDHLEIGLNAASHHGVIVDQKNLDWRHLGCHAIAAGWVCIGVAHGTEMCRVVPAPAALLMLRTPPICSTRSVMVRRPRCPAGTEAGSKPTPSSSMSSTN